MSGRDAEESSWWTGKWERADVTRAAAMVERTIASGQKALGVHVGRSPLSHPGARGDPSPCALALSDGADHTLAVQLENAADLHVLAPLLASDVYVVSDRAHDLLRALADEGLGSPARLGCLESAAILLGESADRRARHRHEDSVAEFLGPGPTQAPADAAEAAARVAAGLIPLMRKMTPALRAGGQAKIFELECKVLDSVVAMERAGIAVDRGAYERIAAGWVRERAQTDDEDPRARRLDKLISTYRYWARDFVDADGRIRFRLHPLVTPSGRFACSDPNVQQVPTEHTAPGLRSAFRAPEGRTLVIADYAQIELRVAAQLAPCEALREVFRRGGDPHRATAGTLTAKAAEDVSDQERKLAKAINFGFLFGMGAKRFRNYARDSYGLDLDEAQARDARAAFFRTFPGVDAWHKRVGALGRQAGPVTVQTAMGRKKTFLEGEFSYSAALNIPVQGTAAEGFKEAMLRLASALPEIDGRGVLCVHDEYVAEVPAQHAERGRAIVESCMREAMARLVPSIPIVVDTQVSDHWH